MEKATFGAGCFWGVEATFRKVPGVKEVTSGYMGGTLDNPTYKDVCSGTTNHAEVVQVEYDPEVVSYPQLLETFFKLHDPTQVNRQGPDVGTQYRSVIFTHSPEQEMAARETVKQLDEAQVFPRPIATLIESAPEFWPAEEYHQRYLERRGLGSCHF